MPTFGRLLDVLLINRESSDGGDQGDRSLGDEKKSHGVTLTLVLVRHWF